MLFLYRVSYMTIYYDSDYPNEDDDNDDNDGYNENNKDNENDDNDYISGRNEKDVDDHMMMMTLGSLLFIHCDQND